MLNYYFLSGRILADICRFYDSDNSDYNRKKGIEKEKDGKELKNDSRNLCGLSHLCHYIKKKKMVKENN